MEKLDLARSVSSLTNAIRKRFPFINDEEAEGIGSALLNEMSQRIEKGETPAFIHRNPQGETELTILGLEITENKKKELESYRRRR